MKKLFLNKVTLFTVIVCFGLVAVLVAHLALSNYSSDSRSTRTANVSVDTMALLQRFDSYDLSVTDEFVSLESVKTIPMSLFSELDELSFNEMEERGPKVVYDVQYDFEAELMYLTMTLVNFDDEVIETDTIVGAMFYNERGQLDAVFNIDDEPVLMSQMRDSGTIENLFLRRIIRNIVTIVAVVAIVTIVAVAAVATAGAAAAVVAAMAVPAKVAAGGVIVGGAVAGGTAGIGAVIGGIVITGAVVASVAVGVYLASEFRVASLALITELALRNDIDGVHFPAERRAGRLWILPVPVNTQDAATRFVTGRDYWSIRSQALRLANQVRTNVGVATHRVVEEADRGGTVLGYYWHFHVENTITRQRVGSSRHASHSFFGNPIGNLF